MMNDLFSFQQVYRSYLKCRGNKRNSPSALRFEMAAEEKLVELQEKLNSESYQPSSAICFVLEKPKLREIFASDFSDRVVHHLIVSRLERIWEPRFIHDSYSCRKDKGIHAAVSRLRQFMRQASSNGVKRAYSLHLDVKDYFMSIDKQILFALIARRVANKKMLRLIEKTVYFDPTQNYRYVGRNANALKKIPGHKSLYYKNNERGIPIGNLTSQFFANVYLDPLDQFCKHELKCRHYLRYCDDLILLSDSRGQLLEWQERIYGFLGSRLKLKLNEKLTRIEPLVNGVDFLGYIIRKDYVLVRKRVVGNFHAKLQDYESQVVEARRQGVLCHFDARLCQNMRASVNSYLGHFRHADSWQLIEKIFHDYSFLWEYFKRDGNKIAPLFGARKRFRCLADQYGWLKDVFAGRVVLFQVGCFVEAFDRNAAALMHKLPLRPLAPRPGFRNRCGFPLASLRYYVNLLIRHRISFVYAAQLGAEGKGVQPRDVRMSHRPIQNTCLLLGRRRLI